MLTLKTFPAAKGSRNMKTRLEPFSLSFCRATTQTHTLGQAKGFKRFLILITIARYKKSLRLV